jgi:hypothetical protein
MGPESLRDERANNRGRNSFLACDRHWRRASRSRTVDDLEKNRGPHQEIRNRTTQPSESHRVEGSLAKTIELGRRVLELAAKLGATTDGQRAPSFRLIAKQLDAPRGASSVWRAAAIYRLAERYPELYGYRHLGVGHLAVLLALRGPIQLELLRQAEGHRWSRRKLEAKVRRIIDHPSHASDSPLSLLDIDDLSPESDPRGSGAP